MKKVLIITYYWPPAGGPGVQRWLKFVKYLPEFDIDPIVFIPENPDYPMTDNSLEKEVSPDLKIIRQRIFEPYKFARFFSKKKTNQLSSGIIDSSENQSFLQRLMLYIRGNIFIPDARRFWIRPSIKYLENYLKKEQIDWIITTGPPHSLHLIGLGLKQRLDIKWLADFRDPWTEIGYHKRLKLSKSSQKKHQQLEAEVLNNADQIITTSYKTSDDFRKITDQPITVITNGYDTESRAETYSLDNNFTLSHIGNLLSGRNPENLWIALKELIEEKPEIKSKLKIQLIGKLSEEVITSLNKNGLNPYTDIKGYLPHKEAVAYQQKAQVLLVIEVNSKETQGIIPGKIFEYLHAKRPVLAIGPNNWDLSKIIMETTTGHCFTYSEKEAIKEAILSFFEAFKKGNLKVDSQNIEKFHRRELTKRLSEILND